MSRFDPEKFSQGAVNSNGPEQLASARISLAGQVVVASPSLSDAVFGRSVCIIVEHTKERAIGIVLNRPLDVDPEPLFETILEGSTLSRDAHINFGGPQSGPVVAIHDDQKLSEGGNALGIYLSAQAESLKQLATAPNGKCRLFVGHALWGPNELEQQIVDGLWYVVPAIPELVFEAEEAMWSKAVRSIGNGLMCQIAGVPPTPIACLLN